MEVIELKNNTDSIIQVSNPFGETYADYLSLGTYSFEPGNVYGIICEHGAGGEAISLALAGEIDMNNTEIFVDGVKDSSENRIGWYVGKTVYSTKFGIKRECSVKKALQEALNSYKMFNNIEEVIDKFHLSPDKLAYTFSNNTDWERWRASLALGYISNKKVFCFPWMNSLQFYDCMYNSSVFRFFNDIKKDGGIIVLPTSRSENVEGIADIIINVENKRFERKFVESEWFKNSH